MSGFSYLAAHSLLSPSQSGAEAGGGVGGGGGGCFELLSPLLLSSEPESSDTQPAACPT